MKIYNTLTKKIEEFIPNNKECVSMYTCGPTVYNYAHIGNLRTYIFEDIFEKGLTFLGYNVKRVMNITDVGHLTSDADTGEDKMLKGAKKEGKTPQELAEFYTKAFFDDLDKLNIKKPDVVSKATEHIVDYIRVIEVLLDKGYAYKSGGNIYFDISKSKDYYKLSGKNEEELIVGARADVSLDDSKRNPYDFALWFTKSKFDDQDQKWDSPFGVGYPGWHIECSTISSIYLGEYLDIHCGGVDNIFPHHTNEIAQSEAYFGHKWCNYFVHGEHLNDKDGKMSKSKGEFLTLKLLEEKGYNPLVYKYFCLGSHYRKQLVFSYDSLDLAKIAYDKLRNKTSSLNEDGDINNDIVNKYKNTFSDAISNDLNTSLMITCVYDILKEDCNDSTKKEIIRLFDEVLGLDLLKKLEKETNVSEEYILEQIELRKQAKLDKNYALADSIRDNLLKIGVKLIDKIDGTSYEII